MIHCYEFLRFSGYFESPLFGTFFHFSWYFEIAGFDCTFISKSLSHRNFIMEKLILANCLIRCSTSHYYKRMCMAMKCFCYFVMQRVSVFFQASCSGENVFTSFMYNFERENYYYLTTVFYNQRWEQPRSQGLSGERPKETLGTSLRWENFNYSIYFVSLMR